MLERTDEHLPHPIHLGSVHTFLDYTNFIITKFLSTAQLHEAALITRQNQPLLLSYTTHMLD
jgi:hypothetical protein